MIDRRDNQVVQSFTRTHALRGVSALAMLAAGLAATPAAAQEGSPGSPQCPLVASTVTCAGDIRNGFRSDNHPSMEVLTLAALTQPIAPPPSTGVIDVRTANNLALTLAPGVTINATRPFSDFGIATGVFSFGTETIERPVAAINLVFDRAAGRTASITNAGTINASIDPRGSTNYYGGGLIVSGAADVTLVNTGTINTDVLVESSTLFQFQPIRIDFADRISVTNNGRLSFLGEGTDAGSNQIMPAVDLRGRAVTFVNNGTITGDGPDFASASIVALPSALGPASIAFTNAGTISHGNDPQYNDTDGVTDFDPGLLILFGGGSVDFRNTGTINDMNHIIYGIGTAAGQTQTVRIENGGTLNGATIEADVGVRAIEGFEDFNFDGTPRRFDSTYDRFDQVPRAPLDTINFIASNSGTLRDSTIVANLRARNSIDIVASNTGPVEGGGFDLTAQSNTFEGPVTITATFSNTVDVTNAFFGVQLFGDNTTLRFENSGNIGSRADIDFRPGLAARAGTLIFRNSGDLSSLLGQGITLEGNSIDAVNSGDLTIDGFNGEFDFPYGIVSQQGFSGDRRAFDRTTTLRNDGVITITYNINTPAVDQNGSFATGIAAAGTGDLLLTNNGAINVAGRDGTGPADITGILLDGYRNVTLANSAPVNLDISRNNQVSAAILFFERSIGAGQFQTYLNSGTIRGPYDRDADVNSRIRIMTTANITATGPGAIGIGGVLGLSDVNASGRDFDGDLEGFVFENDRAAALIDVPAGVSVTGGGGAASAINIQGIGTVTINNRGSIVGRGDASSAAIMIGGQLITGLGDEQTADPLPPLPTDRFLNLVDMVNAGIVRSDNGYGIRAVEGSISNLVNRGLIFGGVASLRAARASSILNDSGGTLDGRLLLEGAGSSLVNNGIVQVSTPGAVTHRSMAISLSLGLVR